MKKLLLYIALISFSSVFAQEEISDDNYTSKTNVQNNRLIIVSFTANWCGSCKALEPVVRELAQENSNNTDFYQIDVDQNPISSVANAVRVLPTLLFYKNGKLVYTKKGRMTKEQFLEVIKSLKDN